MGSTLSGSGASIAVPKGGGALHGIGEKFAPNLHTGTGNFDVPIQLPSGRGGFQPQLGLSYSSGNGNSAFGLGWSLSVPSITRKTSHGIPRYDESDVFILSGAEDLVPVGVDDGEARTRFRPRTEGFFARIERIRGDDGDYWQVRNKDGLVSTYGTPRPNGASVAWRDPAAVADPDNPTRIFAWKLTRTRDPFGNLVEYLYTREASQIDGPHVWDQLYLSQVRYADYGDPASPTFLVTVGFDYEARPDPSSEYRAGFEIRTVQRCSRIRVVSHADADRPVRTHHLRYADEHLTGAELSANRVSLLTGVQVEGHDGDRSEWLPMLELEYTRFELKQRRFEPIGVAGSTAPDRSLAAPDYDLVDVFGNGLPSVLQLNGTARYWRNLGSGRFSRPHLMTETPAGVSLADRGAQISDMDGDGRPDLLVSAGTRNGYFPLAFGGRWDHARFVAYRQAPPFDLEDPETRLLDLDGDGVSDVLRTGESFELYYAERGLGWSRRQLRPRRDAASFPDVNLSDSRVKVADMNGDGLQDIVLIHDGRVDYWPYLGYGRWGARITMRGSPRFADATADVGLGYDPRRVLLGDVDGDGCADLVYVGSAQITVWLNRTGNGWSEPVTIYGTPTVTSLDAVRLADMHGTGTAGILWTYDQGAQRESTYKFLDLTGGVKPYLLRKVDNHLGAVTQIEYAPSTRFYLEDERQPETRWKTTLPFPVQVVARVETNDAISGGRLTSQYRYHHGYWDGAEREFRGFGRVDQRDTETLGGGQAADQAVTSYAPPIETRTWFHQGPVGPEYGAWEELDLSSEYWPDDPSVFQRPEGLTDLTTSLSRRDLRDALRTLRGRALRTEMYALDGSERQDRPYTITEQLHDVVRIEATGTQPANSPTVPVFFPRSLAQRTTQWERGEEPMTQLTFTWDYDAYGQPRSQLSEAVARGRDYQQAATSAKPYLVTQTTTRYAQRDDPAVYIVDRVAEVATYEIVNDGSTSAFELRDAVAGGHATRRLFSHALTFYDGPAFEGLPFGQLGTYGALVRSEHLVLTPDILQDAYRSGGTLLNSPEIPPYLAPTGAPAWPSEYPQGFRGLLPAYAGHIFHQATTGSPYQAGYYTVAERRRYDIHDSSSTGTPGRGLVLVTRDALGWDTKMQPDHYGVFPDRVTNPVGLVTRAAYDYRVFQPREVVDANGNWTRSTFTPLGHIESQSVGGKSAGEGDSAMPSLRLEYDFQAFVERSQPIAVRSIRRVYHDTDGSAPADRQDETIESIEYSDGVGRLLQTRTQAEDIVFGDPLFGDAGLSADQAAPLQDAVGRQRAIADPPRVVVSGWQVYDNKGRIVEKYEPFFSEGWAYAAPGDAQLGQKATMYYDPRGLLVRTVNPDGSEQRGIYGVPVTLDDPEHVTPTPWEIYTYDANDNAGRTHTNDPLAGRYRQHWNTPSSQEVDALGRTIRTIERNGSDPANFWYTTRSSFDIRGNLLTVVDALGRVACQTVYDLANRPVRVETLDGGIRRSVLDASGRTIEDRDSRGMLRLSASDALGRPIRLWARDSAAEPVTLRERIIYSDSSESGLSATAAAALNLLEQPYRHYDEAGLLSFEAYDFKGNLLEKTRQVIADAVLLAPFAGPPPGWKIPAFQADWEPPAGTALDTHAARLLTPTRYQTSSTYDALGRLSTLRYPGDVVGVRQELRPTYNRAGSLERIVLGGTTYVERIAYNAKGQRTLIVYGNGLMTRYAYDRRTFRLERLRTEAFSVPSPGVYRPTGAAGRVHQDTAYEYDPAGNLLASHDRAPGMGVPATPDALDRAFTYDPMYRLLSATGRECDVPPAPPPWDDRPRGVDLTRIRSYTETYQYDPLGNLVRLQHGPDAGSFARVLDLQPGGNRLARLTIGTTSYPYSYDASGNMVGEGVDRQLGWDHANRLRGFRRQVGTAEPSVHSQYLYDASGQRVKRLVRKQGGRVDVTVWVDGLFEHHVVALPGGSRQENNRLHVLDNQRRVAMARVGQPFSDDAGPAIQYHLGDHLDSKTLVIDAAGTWVNREEYTPYGETSFGSFARKRYRYTGKERDEESGLYYHGARYFTPWLGRWTSCDRVGPVSDARGVAPSRPYAYVEGRALVAVDPDGNAINLIAGAIGAAAGALIGGGIEAGRQLIASGSVNDWGKVGASAAGGAISGALAGVTMGGSLVAQAALAGATSVAGGATTRALLGEKQTAGAVAQDFTVGVVTFGLIKGGTAAARSVASTLRSTATAGANTTGASATAAASTTTGSEGAVASATARISKVSSSVLSQNKTVGRAGEEMAEYSLKNAHENFHGATIQKSSLKNAAGETVYTGGGRKGARFPDAVLPAENGAVSTLEIKTLQNPIDPAAFAKSSKQLAKEATIMQSPTFWGPKDNLSSVVAGEGPGVTTGYWVWKPPTGAH